MLRKLIREQPLLFDIHLELGRQLENFYAAMIHAAAVSLSNS